MSKGRHDQPKCPSWCAPACSTASAPILSPMWRWASSFLQAWIQARFSA